MQSGKNRLYSLKSFWQDQSLSRFLQPRKINFLFLKTALCVERLCCNLQLKQSFIKRLYYFILLNNSCFRLFLITKRNVSILKMTHFFFVSFPSGAKSSERSRVPRSQEAPLPIPRRHDPRTRKGKHRPQRRAPSLSGQSQTLNQTVWITQGTGSLILFENVLVGGSVMLQNIPWEVNPFQVLLYFPVFNNGICFTQYLTLWSQKDCFSINTFSVYRITD